MMDGYTALALMRAKRARDEVEVAAPHIATAMLYKSIAEGEKAARSKLERLLKNELMPHILEQVGRNLGEGVHREIMKAVGSQASYTATTTLNLPTAMLLAADPESVVGRIVEWWRSSVAPKMEIAAMTDVTDKSVMIMDIRLPQMGYREHVLDKF